MRGLLASSIGIVIGFACAAGAQPVVDGTRDASYGQPVTLQTVSTGFGDATQANGLGGGGELNAAYARIDSGRLYLLLTGNLENNFNKLSVFFDTDPGGAVGGESTLSAAPGYDFENISQNFGGLTFDDGFTPELHLYARWGSFSGNVFTVDMVDRAGGANSVVRGNGASATVGVGTAIQSGVVMPSDLGLAAGPGGQGEARTLSGFLAEPLEFGFNNTNTAGVGAGSGAADPVAAAAVTTGVELSIALADLGATLPGDPIRLQAVYGNSNHNFLSNQSLPGLPAGTGNLGGDGAGNFTGTLSGVDFRQFAEDQFLTLTVPGLPGDFNGDDRVDAADYTVWRDGLGNGFTIDDYEVWSANFGAVAVANTEDGSNASSRPVPEPAPLGAVLLALVLLPIGFPRI